MKAIYDFDAEPGTGEISIRTGEVSWLLIGYNNVIDIRICIGSSVCICIYIRTYPFINLKIHYQMEFRNSTFLTCTETLVHNSTE